jgi:uncharacterized RDD family membrane protein YckC
MSSQTSQTTASDRLPDPPCSLLRRSAAMLYDGLLLVALWMVASAAVVIPLDDSVSVGNPLFQLYILLVSWGYFAVFWRGGKTLGMKAWRLRIDAPEQPISWRRTVVRFTVGLASLLPFGLGFLWSLLHPEKATWHDLASGTRLRVEPARNRAKP